MKPKFKRFVARGNEYIKMLKEKFRHFMEDDW